jgi:hypothetical protein
VFADPAAIDLSLAIAVPAMMTLGMVLLAIALSPYRSMLIESEPREIG